MPKPVPVPSVRGPYETIAEALRDDIRSGRLKPGDELPTVADLAVADTVAVGTAHRAMALLNDEGLVVAGVDVAHQLCKAVHSMGAYKRVINDSSRARRWPSD